MNAILLNSDLLGSMGAIIALVSPFVFLTGLLMIIFSEKNRKLGIKLLIGSVIAFIVGFGTCFANLSLGGMH